MCISHLVKSAPQNKTEACPPLLCPDCAEHIENSNLHWVQCGGISVGTHRSPLVWRLRYKDENLTVQQRTKDLQKLAGAMRYLVQCKPYLPPDLADKVENFCKNRGPLCGDAK